MARAEGSDAESQYCGKICTALKNWSCNLIARFIAVFRSRVRLRGRSIKVLPLTRTRLVPKRKDPPMPTEGRKITRKMMRFPIRKMTTQKMIE